MLSLFRLPSFAKRVLAKSPAPIVTAPAASDLPKKERRLKEPFDGLIVSVAWLISVSPKHVTAALPVDYCATYLSIHFCRTR